MKKVIVLAGATGALGQLIGHELLRRGAGLRALVREGTAAERTAGLREAGAEIVPVNFGEATALTDGCRGAHCVVSALSGLHEVIVRLQTQLVDAAVAAGVPRFIPSDYSVDFTTIVPGTNRNLDYRREFQRIVDEQDIAVTSVLNGMFADLLTGEAPLILFAIRRVLVFGDPDQPIDVTTMRNTAQYTAAVALDDDTPRWLRIAGEVTTARGLADTAAAVTGKPFGLLRPGGIGTFDTLIKVTRFFAPARDELFPPWQGMQYLRDMYSGRAKLATLDNDRYPDIRWEGVAQVLERR